MHVRRPRPFAITVALATLAGACQPGPGPDMRFIAGTPHQAYEARLRQAGLDGTALGRDWLASARDALGAPVDVDAPHLETRFLNPASATAVAYRMTLERGQRLVAALELADGEQAGTRVFLDLFFTPDTLLPLRLAATADSLARGLEYVALRPGTYVLRVQPELLRGGRVTLSLTTRASLGFPVVGKDMAGIRSRFGAPRDGGRREHHGVDIFAPRGTPVVAAVAGHVSRVRTSGLGGNVVWLREDRYDRRLYYAHLDRQAVLEGAWVEPGDTLGFVGNTGNARTTPPHLHFGIYMRGAGPVDPHFHLYDPPHALEPFAGDTALVGRWARVGRTGATVRSRPQAGAPTVAREAPFTPVQLLAGSGRWYRAQLPDGRQGYLSLRETDALTPLELATVIGGSLLRGPTPGGAALDSLADGDTVPVLGRFGEFAFVEWIDGRSGWVAGDRLAGPGRAASTAPPAGAPRAGAGGR